MTDYDRTHGPAAGPGIGRAHRVRAVPMAEGGSVTTLELFFDLVFVFALTQVTATMAHGLNALTVFQGLLVLALLWWSWTGYAWLANLVRADRGLARVGLFAAMAAMFVLALTIPEAFHDAPGGLPGPVVLAVCYFVFRSLHLLLFYLFAGADAELRAQLLRFTPAMLAGTGLLLGAAAAHGTTQLALWVAALAADYLGTYFGGARGWRVRSVGHFAERHGLIVIVALGESIVAIGVGVAALPVSWPVVAASVLGLTLAAGLWWAYFDLAAAVTEHALADAPEAARAAMARDAYSFLHLPLVAGIVLLALGLKKVMEYVGDAEAHDLTDPLKGAALAALVGGAVLYLLAHVAFKLRTTGRVNVVRLAVAALLIPAGWAFSHLPALAALACLTAAVVALLVVERLRSSDEGDRLGYGEHEPTAPHPAL